MRATAPSEPLPSGWRLITLGDVTESMKNGIYKPASAYADYGLACLRMYNIAQGRRRSGAAVERGGRVGDGGEGEPATGGAVEAGDFAEGVFGEAPARI
jgi:hypothetical protein